jgi:hypothetical protein
MSKWRKILRVLIPTNNMFNPFYKAYIDHEIQDSGHSKQAFHIEKNFIIGFDYLVIIRNDFHCRVFHENTQW